MSATKRKVLPFADKLRVVEMCDKGYSYASVASEFDFGKLLILI